MIEIFDNLPVRGGYYRGGYIIYIIILPIREGYIIYITIFSFLYFTFRRFFPSFCGRNPIRNPTRNIITPIYLGFLIALTHLFALLDYYFCPFFDTRTRQNAAFFVGFLVKTTQFERGFQHLLEFLRSYCHFFGEYLPQKLFRNVKFEVGSAINPLQHDEVEGVSVVAVEGAERFDFLVVRSIYVVREVIQPLFSGSRHDSALLRFLKDPNIFAIDSKMSVGSVPDSGSIDPFPANQSEAQTLDFLRMPLRNSDEFPGANVVFDVDNHDTSWLQDPNALFPDPSMGLSIRLSPLQSTGICRMKRPSQHVAVGIAARSVSGVVMIATAVAVDRACDNGVKFFVIGPGHVGRVSHYDLDVRVVFGGLVNPFGFKVLDYDPSKEAVVSKHADFPDARHRV